MQSTALLISIYAIFLLSLSVSASAQSRQVNMAIGGHFPMAAFHMAAEKGYYKQNWPRADCRSKS